MIFGFVLTPRAPSASVEARKPILSLAKELRAQGQQIIDAKKVHEYQKIQLNRLTGIDRMNASWEMRFDLEQLDAPPDVLRKAALARQIPGAIVYAEALKKDPFLVVARLKTPSKGWIHDLLRFLFSDLIDPQERYYIHYWNAPDFQP